MKHRWGLGAALVLLAVTAAHGQSKEKQSVGVTSESIVARMDRNGDGKISQEEFRNAMMRRFSAADANGDGELKGDEIPTHSVVVQKSEVKVGDVKRDDYSAALEPVFNDFDTDHDGVLAGGEIEALAKARRDLKEAKP